MPDVFSIGLGGGSIVRLEGPEPAVGPRSVGYEITRRARIFGGDVLTATDVAVALGRTAIGDAALVAGLDAGLLARIRQVMERRFEIAVDRCRVSTAAIPILAVGGGSILVPDQLGGTPVSRPAHFAVANAIGAAIAQTSGEVDRICSLDTLTREAALAGAEQEAREKAIKSGAIAETLTVTEREDVPLAYLRGNATRVRVKVVGDLRI
jgi:N-methylhydantoinase A/oxoprolinase/acetone carboxylase beta subunit